MKLWGVAQKPGKVATHKSAEYGVVANMPSTAKYPDKDDLCEGSTPLIKSRKR